MATRYTKYAKLLESVDYKKYINYVVDYIVLFRFLLSLYIMT